MPKRASKSPATIKAPLLHFPFDCDRSEVSDYRMPHFVRRNELAMHLVVEGKVQVFISNGQKLKYPVGLAFSWGAIPHRAEFYGRVTIYHFAIPLGWFLRWGLPEPFTRGVLGGRTFFEPNPAWFTHDLAMFERWNRDMKGSDAEAKRTVLLEVEARLRRLAMDVDLTHVPRVGGAAGGGAKLPVDKVERMILHIAKNYSRALGVEEIAEAVGLHPDYASRLFSRSTGVGLLDFLTQHRVATAQSLLASTDAKIGDVAIAAGFGSVSQFHAVFKRHAGCSPAGYRQKLKEG